MHRCAQRKQQSTTQRKQRQADSNRSPGRPIVVPEFKQRVGSLYICLAIDRAVDCSMELVDRPVDRNAYSGCGLQFPNVTMGLFLIWIQIYWFFFPSGILSLYKKEYCLKLLYHVIYWLIRFLFPSTPRTRQLPDHVKFVFPSLCLSVRAISY